MLSFRRSVAGAIPTSAGFNPCDKEEMGEPRPMTLPPDSIGRGLAPVSILSIPGARACRNVTGLFFSEAGYA